MPPKPAANAKDAKKQEAPAPVEEEPPKTGKGIFIYNENITYGKQRL